MGINNKNELYHMKESFTTSQDGIEDAHTELILKRLILVCIAITVGISSAAIIGWVLNWLFLARINPNYIPIAQSTALSFIILSFALFAYARMPKHPHAITLARVGVSLVLILSFIIFIDRFTDAGLYIEQLLYSHTAQSGSAPIGLMSSITAADFLLSACALLLLLIVPESRHRIRSAVSFLAFIVTSSGLVMVLGYLYGTPLLYGGIIIPVALPTAISFVFMGIGLIAAAGQHYYPVSPFTGSSVQAKLMRTLIPVTIVIILINGWIYNILSSSTGNYVLASSLAVIFSVVLVSIFISKIVQIIGSNIDRVDAERRLVEGALQKSEECFRFTMQSAYDAIIVVNGKGDIIVWNNSAKKMFGYSEEEALGMSLMILMPEKFRLDHKKKLDQVTLTGKTNLIGKILELQGLKKNGIEFPIELTLATWVAGKERFYSGIIRDITERKQAEKILMESKEFIQTVLNSMNDSIFVIDAHDFKIIDVNSVFLDTYGLNSEDVIGKACYEITHKRTEPCAPPDNSCPLLETHSTGGYSTFEHVYYTKSGERRYKEVSTSPIKDENGAVVSVIHVSRDITERKRAEEDIRKLNSELEQRVQERTSELEEKNKELLKLDKAKSDFLDTVSHELRTPLTSIIGYSKLLLDGVQGEMSEKQIQYVERIWARGNHQLMLVNDVLDFSKLESGHMVFTMGTVSVVEILSDTIDDEMPSIKQKGQEIILEVSDGVSNVYADKLRFKQVLTNLINNAIKFTPDNGRIIVKADNVGGMVKISIIDNGIGIKEENLERMFDNFVQVDQSNSRSFGGTGLGLAIVRDLMKHMGGSIEVESEYGKGSTFSILMPREESMKV